MKILEKSIPSSRRQARTAKPPAPNRAKREASPADIKLLLVAFRNGEAVDRHPALKSWIDDGWQVRSAVPRIVENGATRLLVILERPILSEEPVRPSTPQRMRSLRE